MASLHQLTIGDDIEFKRQLAAAGYTAEDIRKLNKNPGVLAAMRATMREHPVFRLIHGRFAPFAETIKAVEAYPGVTAADIAAAVDEAHSFGLLDRYEAESPRNPFLVPVVVVYRATAAETLLYARDRMRDAFGADGFEQWEDAHGQNVDENRVRLLEGITAPTNRIRIEVVGLGDNWNPKDGFVPKDIRNAQSAHAAVIFAAAQNLEWVREMDGKTVPYALAGGYELNVPGRGPWARVPGVWHSGERAGLGGRWCARQYHGYSLPSLRE